MPVSESFVKKTLLQFHIFQTKFFMAFGCDVVFLQALFYSGKCHDGIVIA
jgi:hypothetical protein